MWGCLVNRFQYSELLAKLFLQFAPAPHIFIMLGQCVGKNMPARAVGDKIQRRCAGRVKHGGQRRTSGVGDGGGGRPKIV